MASAEVSPAAAASPRWPSQPGRRGLANGVAEHKNTVPPPRCRGADPTARASSQPVREGSTQLSLMPGKQPSGPELARAQAAQAGVWLRFPLVRTYQPTPSHISLAPTAWMLREYWQPDPSGPLGAPRSNSCPAKRSGPVKRKETTPRRTSSGAPASGHAGRRHPGPGPGPRLKVGISTARWPFCPLNGSLFKAGAEAYGAEPIRGSGIVQLIGCRRGPGHCVRRQCDPRAWRGRNRAACGDARPQWCN